MELRKCSFDVNYYSLLSDTRSACMGFAILLVLSYHFGVGIPIIKAVAQNGFIGVDIFMFLSGFGLYHSMTRSDKLLLFYEKRAFRIFPCYIVVGIVWSFLILHDSLLQFVMKCSTVGFWIAGNALSYEWFIPSIVLLYILYPFYYKMSLKNDCIPFILFAVFLLFSFLSAFSIINVAFPFFFLMYRIPCFILGSICASKVLDNKKVILIIIASSVIALLCLFASFDPLKEFYFGRSFFLPVLMLILCMLFGNFSLFNRFFSILGASSLEVYLAHFLFLKSSLELNPFFLILLSLGVGISLSKMNQIWSRYVHMNKR